MYEKGQLIAVDGVIYEYDGIEADGLHRVYVIDIDEEGILTHTYNSWYLTDEELTTGFNKINLTQKQWCGVVSLLLREKLKYSEEIITEAAEDIVYRCFAISMPKFDELQDYIDCYMDR